jgi:hypothetical protein
LPTRVAGDRGEATTSAALCRGMPILASSLLRRCRKLPESARATFVLTSTQAAAMTTSPKNATDFIARLDLSRSKVAGRPGSSGAELARSSRLRPLAN